jgi:proteasome assembly chaperone (PAC2) family protein
MTLNIHIYRDISHVLHKRRHTMPEDIELNKIPESEETFLLAGWRQWADAGSVSSGLPEYLVKLVNAKKIGSMRPDGFYLFQLPGTHDLIRPVVTFRDGYPVDLDAPRNDLYYTGDKKRGLAIFLGDEPHMDIERYVTNLLAIARTLKVKRIIGFGGVYGEVPYDKERMVSAIYSLPEMKEELAKLAVTFSDYEGGASIESFICKRAAEQGIDFAALYAFVPAYDFSGVEEIGNTIRLEDDYTAWLGILRRVQYLLKLDLNLGELEEKSNELTKVVREKIDEIDSLAPQIGLKEFVDKIRDEYSEVQFNPLDEVWEDELRRLFDKYDLDEP